MDVPMAVCITVMLGKLSHIATGDQIAPWREPLSCSMSGAVSASLALLSARVFCGICRRLRHRMETQIAGVHASGRDACTHRIRDTHTLCAILLTGQHPDSSYANSLSIHDFSYTAFAANESSRKDAW